MAWWQALQIGAAQDWTGSGPPTTNGSRYLMCLRSDPLRYVIERLALPGKFTLLLQYWCKISGRSSCYIENNGSMQWLEVPPGVSKCTQTKLIQIKVLAIEQSVNVP